MALDYRPEGMSMWDTWYVEYQGQAHMIHLQRLAPDTTRDPADANWLGHATSSDLVHWDECPLALGPGAPDTIDEWPPWTGCVLEHEGTFYLYYTMRSKVGAGFGQRIGLATSNDSVHWVRYPNNPVIVPDERWYTGHSKPLLRDVLDCRDLIVIPNPDGAGWLGFYAARVPAEEEAETAVIAAVRSTDLIHWEHLSPAFNPRKYACIEVPDVFFLDGKWYMICLTGNGYGNRGIFSDPSVLRGTIYAVAERPEGPYHEIEGDNVLIGGDKLSGYPCRSLVFEGERYMFYTQPTPDGRATLSPPMRLKTLPGGQLRLAYSPRTATWRRAVLIGPGAYPAVAHLPFSQCIWPLQAGRWEMNEPGVYRGESRTGWQVADLGLGAENVEVEAHLLLQSGAAAGIVFRPNTANSCPAADLSLILDTERQCVLAAHLPDFDKQQRRAFPVQPGQRYHIRVCIRPPRYEVFIDDILVLQAAGEFHELAAPSIGLFVDRGRVEFSNLIVYSLL